jgi:hypothetical protein
MDDWPAARAVLRGEREYEPAPPVIEAPPLLSPRERRRTSRTVRLALGAAHQATADSGVAPTDLAAVFGSSCGDGATLNQLLTTLADPEGMVSPTQFHNSVHNAAIGYWSIATGSKLPATSIAAHDFTFAASLLKASVQARADAVPVLMAVYDIPLPGPLHAARPLSDSFAVALVLTADRIESSVIHLDVAWPADANDPPSPPRLEALDSLWRGNPAARALPLLEVLARGDSAELVIRYPTDGSLRLKLGE